MKIQVGKRYVRRDGKVSGKIIVIKTKDLRRLYRCPKYNIDYTECGEYLYSGAIELDLVSEYVEEDVPEVKPEDLHGYNELQKERREFWAKVFLSGFGLTCKAEVNADLALAEFDKRFPFKNE